jgi:hypothetical protein
MQDDFDKFYAAGADLVLQKPLKNDKLLKVLGCFNGDAHVEPRRALQSLKL